YLGLRVDATGKIVEATADSPAEKAGLQPGDFIVAVNRTSVVGLSRSQRVSLLRGELGESVSLQYRRAGALQTVTMIRAALGSLKTAPVKTPATDPLDAQIVSVYARSPHTDGCYALVMEGMGYLPAAVKRHLIRSGVTLVLTPTLQQLTGQVGASRYDTKRKRAIVCERSDGHESDAENDPRLSITTLHELGHAYDWSLGRFALTAAFLGAYDKEAPAVPEQDRQILAHFLQPGQHGPSECFASLFVAKYYRPHDRRIDTLKRCFPNTFEIVKAIPDT
ncbi:unnamed protein product, partial [Phaeothamnion confervicola]